MGTRFLYSALRFVPDPARGEFVNIGLLIGSEQTNEWQLRTIENLRRAKALDSMGVLNQALAVLMDLRTDLDSFSYSAQGLFEISERFAPSLQAGEEWLKRLHEDWQNVIQLSPPAPIVADNIKKATDILFDELIVDRKSTKRRPPSKSAAYSNVRKAYNRALPQGSIEERCLVRSTDYSDKVDFVIANGTVVQLTHTWSFQINDEHLKDRVKAWAFTVEDVRARGGETQFHDRLVEVPKGVPINVVYLKPVPSQRVAFAEAKSAFRKLKIDSYEVAAVDSVVLQASRLLASSFGNGAGLDNRESP